MFSAIWWIGTWPGPSIITCTPLLPGHLRELAEGLELGELRLVVRVGDAARTQAVAEAERHVVLRMRRTDRSKCS